MLGVFWLTTDCNLDCVYCYEGKKKKKYYMTNDIAIQSIEFLLHQCIKKNKKRINVEFHGGEPFLAYEEIYKITQIMIEKSKSLGIEVRFGCTTNATLLSIERLEFIDKYIEDFTISIDGDAETQNFSRPLKCGGKSSRLVEKWCKEALKIMPDLRVRMTFNHKTVSCFFKNIKYLAELGVKYIVPARDFFDEKFDEHEFEILKLQLEETKKYVKACQQGLFVSMLEVFPSKKLGRCSGGLDSFHISYKGDVFPCALTVNNPEYIIGNVRTGVNSQKRDKLLLHSDYENKKCIGCDIYDYCEQTRCKLVNKMITGEFCEPSAIACAENRLLLTIGRNNE